MSKALKRYKAGDWNNTDVEVKDDGSRIVTLRKEGEKPVKFRVKNLYKENEEEVDIVTGKSKR